MDKKRWIVAGFLGIALLVAGFLLASPRVVYPGESFFSGQGSAFRYTGEILQNGEVLVTVSVDIDNPNALRAYVEAATNRGWALIQSGDPQTIWVQVTFRRPVPIPEVRALVEETGFRVDSYLLVGRHPTNGERMYEIQFGPLEDSAIHTTFPQPPPAPPDPGVDGTLAGVMLLQGEVDTTEQGLGRWLADERVYLMDTTSVEMHQLVAQRHAAVVSGKEIEISVPSPFWNLDW